MATYAQQLAAWRKRLPALSARYNRIITQATGAPIQPPAPPPPPPPDASAADNAAHQRAIARHEKLNADLAARRKKQQKSQTRTAAIIEGRTRKKSPAEQKAADIAAGRTSGGSTTPKKTTGAKGKPAGLGGSGGVGRTISQPLGSIPSSNPTSPFGYFNEPGFTEGRFYRMGPPKGRGDAPTWEEVSQQEAVDPETGQVKDGYQQTGGLNAGFGAVTTAGYNAVQNEVGPQEGVRSDVTGKVTEPFGSSRWASVPARYLEGDGKAILGQLFGSDAFLQVQQALKAAHPGRAAINYGTVDDNTTTWFNQVLGEANALGVSWQDRLFGGVGGDVASAADDGSGGGSGGGGGGGGGGSASLLTDPESIMQAADQIAQDTIGRRLDAAMKQRMVDEIHGLESNPDPTTTLDLSAEIQRRVREWNQQATQGHDESGIASVIMNMFQGGPGGGAPSGFGSNLLGPQGGSPV